MKKKFTGNNFTAIFTDENGYFSLTGDVDGGGGACGDRLAKIDPRFKLLNDMHLSNKITGEPIHSWANANYFLKERNLNAFRNQLRHKQDEYKEALEALYDARNLEKDICEYNARVTQPAIKLLQTIKEEITELWKQDVKDVLLMVESIPADLTNIDEDIKLEDFNEQEKVLALAQHLETHFSIIVESDNNTFEAEGSDWLVVTDDEADDLWDESLDSYLNNCVYPELPGNMRYYFDTDFWKQDAKIDGRGHSLNSYDGCEYFEEVDGETYFIYQQ